MEFSIFLYIYYWLQDDINNVYLRHFILADLTLLLGGHSLYEDYFWVEKVKMKIWSDK